MDAFLSIIIPVYKTPEKYLRRCLDSMQAQSRYDFKVFVVDDGSPDNCGQICDEYASKDNRIVVIHQENAGVSVARNKGIDVADTKWITFIDPDDWVENDYADVIYDAVNTNEEIDIFLFDYIQEFAQKSITKQLLSTSQTLDETWVSNLKIAPFNYFVVNGKPFEYETNVIWNKVYRTDLINRHDLRFEDKARKGQDVIFNAECLQLTGRFYYIHKSLYHYRYLSESITNRFNPKVQYYNEVAFENYERIITKYDLPVSYKDAYYARVVTRVFSTMRLYYFHPNNKKKWNEVKKDLDLTLEKSPYREALEKVKYSNLTMTQKIFVYFLKCHQYAVLRLLVNGRLMLQKLAGERLG